MPGERNSPRPDDRAIGREIVERAIGAALREEQQARPAPPRAHPDRALNLWLGPPFFALGAGAVGLFLIGFAVVGAPPGSWVVLLLLLGIFAGIGLVGLNMMIQGKRNRPGAEGFFYSFLGRLTRRSTPVHATLVPLVIGLLAVLEGTLRRNRAATEFGVVAGLTWVSLFVQLFVHEVGHLLAVRRVGLPFVRLAAGPLALFPHGRGYRLAANRDWLHFMLGVVEYGLLGSPSARKTLFVASAGPIATAFLGLFALGAEESFLADGGSSLAVAQANAAIAGGILLVNLIPLRFGHMESDGLQIWLALRSLAGRR